MLSHVRQNNCVTSHKNVFTGIELPHDENNLKVLYLRFIFLCTATYDFKEYYVSKTAQWLLQKKILIENRKIKWEPHYRIVSIIRQLLSL